MGTFTKGALIAEGKTKKLFAVEGSDDLVLVENKTDITKFDDPTQTKSFGTKAAYSTTTTCRVFELLHKAGIPNAYVSQVSPTEFISKNCEMVPLEVVARRYAVGSFLKRHPELENKKDEAPYRFHRLAVEFFLKTTAGRLVVNNKTLVQDLDAKKGEEDPFIANPFDEDWKLYHPKHPEWEPAASLERSVPMKEVAGSVDRMKQMEDMLRRTFLVLEGAWNTLGLRLIDMKIEFGIDKAGNLLVADVIDNDSWRLRDDKWEELSKEAFRQGQEISEVEKKYGIVSGLVERIRVPRQALVLWRGSDKDEFPAIDAESGIEVACSVERITISGHKSPKETINTLERILGSYPDGGVIIAKVGRSNGLGPILAARTSWPVIAIPATADKNPEDVWSSVRMPSLVPLATVWPDANAILAASNILAQKNPVLYMKRQQKIESYDE